MNNEKYLSGDGRELDLYSESDLRFLEKVGIEGLLRVLPRLEKNFGNVEWQNKSKTDYNPVTDEDIWAQEEIASFLTAELGSSVGLIGEEDGLTSAEENRIYIDPIDGTKEYIHGIKGAGSMFGTIRSDGMPVHGVYMDIKKKEIYTGSLGNGARQLKVLDDGTTEVLRPLHVSDSELLGVRFQLFNEMTGTPNKIRADLVNLFRGQSIWGGSAGEGFMRVADGTRDVAISIENHPSIKPYDIAAGAGIITAAGGLIENAYRPNMPYDVENTDLVVGNPIIVRAVQEYLEQLATR